MTYHMLHQHSNQHHEPQHHELFYPQSIRQHLHRLLLLSPHHFLELPAISNIP